MDPMEMGLDNKSSKVPVFISSEKLRILKAGITIRRSKAPIQK